MASYQTYVKVFAMLAITVCLSAQLVSSGYARWPSCTPGGVCLKRKSGHNWRCVCPDVYPTAYGLRELPTECQFVPGRWKFLCKPSGNDVQDTLELRMIYSPYLQKRR